MRRRKPVDSQAAMAEGVDYLLREFKGLPKKSGGGGSVSDGFGGPIEPTVLVAASDARPEIKAVADFECDGISDDEEIIAALEYVNTLMGTSGGIIQLTGGIFEISSSIDPSVTSGVGLWLRGAGIRSTTIRTSAAAPSLGDPIIYLQTIQSRISDMAVTTAHTNWTKCIDVIQAIADKPNLIENVYVENTSSSTYAETMAIHTRNYTTVLNCVVGGSNVGYGVDIGGTNCIIDNVRINGATIIATGGGYGIRADDLFAQDLLVVNSTITNCAGAGIYLEDDDGIILGNRVDDSIIIHTTADGTVIGANIGTVTDNGTNTVFLDNTAINVSDVSPLTTKGDLWGYDTADNRLPVGADTHVLTADSAETLGVKWSAAAAGVGGGKATTLMLGGM